MKDVNTIIKESEYCINNIGNSSCPDCPYTNDFECLDKMLLNSLECIKSLKAKNEMLINILKLSGECITDLETELMEINKK